MIALRQPAIFPLRGDTSDVAIRLFPLLPMSSLLLSVRENRNFWLLVQARSPMPNTLLKLSFPPALEYIAKSPVEEEVRIIEFWD